MIIPFPCPNCQQTIAAEITGLKNRLETCLGCNEQVQLPEDLAIGPGTEVGKGYVLNEKLGESPLGEMYKAERRQDGLSCCVEILSSNDGLDDENVQRLRQEVELVASLKHPNIFEAIDAGQDQNAYFLVTAYEPGSTLENYLLKNKPLDESEALRIGISIAEALKFVWEKHRVLHRDVKPENIFIADSGEPKLMGFGIAKSQEQQQSMGLTGMGFIIGTPEYMSPELIRVEGELDFRCDLYALGILLYECVVGELPFEEAAPILLLGKQMDEVPVPVHERNPNVSQSCSQLIAKMLEKDRDDRHQSWQELIDALKSVGGSRVAVATAATAITPGAAKPSDLTPGTGSAAPPAAAATAAAPTPAAAEKKDPVKTIIMVLLIVIVLLLIAVLASVFMKGG